MAAPEVNLKAGCNHDVGDRLGTTTHTTTQTYSGQTNLTITDESFTNPNISGGERGVNITGSCDNITFDHCTFYEIGNVAGHNGGYRWAMINVENSSNVTFTNCHFYNMGRAADQGWRNDMMHVNNITNFTFTNNLIEDVNSDSSDGNYGNGDVGNRMMWVSGGTTGLDISYNTGINPGRNFIQLLNSLTTFNNSEVHHNVIVGSAYNGSAFEDMINLYNAGGQSGQTFKIHHNYFRNGGPRGSGTAFILGDGTTGGTPAYVDSTDNVVVNPGNVGINNAGGNHNLIDNNIIYSAGPETTVDSVGLIVNDFNYVDSCNLNTISNNRVWFYNSQTGGTNHIWNPGTCTNTNDSNNTFGDTGLNLQKLEDVLAVNDVINVTANQQMTPFDLSDSDESYFNDDDYTIISGSLPTGLTMGTDGIISGTPTGSSSVVTYRATNRFGRTSDATATVNVGSLVAFETTNPADSDTNVTTPITPSGTAPNDGATVYQFELHDITNATTLVDYHEGLVTYTSGSETWSADSSEIIPQDGESLQLKARRWGP